jgi:multicomponent Na+:H+ antiporter subunit B
MTQRTESIIIDMVSKTLAPFIQLFALYVITHGHYSPGGGFQGGALFGASLLLLRITLGRDLSESAFPVALGTSVSSLGVFMYALVGVMALLAGGLYLDYGALPWGAVPPAERRALGILLIEIAVGIGVAGTLVAIFDDLAGRAKK